MKGDEGREPVTGVTGVLPFGAVFPAYLASKAASLSKTSEAEPPSDLEPFESSGSSRGASLCLAS